MTAIKILEIAFLLNISSLDIVLSLTSEKTVNTPNSQMAAVDLWGRSGRAWNRGVLG